MLKRALVVIVCAALPAVSVAGGWGGRYHFGGHYHHGHHGGDGDALIAGLVIGGLIGWAVSEDRHYRRRAYPVYSYHHGAYHRPYHRSYHRLYHGRFHHRHYRRPVSVYRDYVPVRPAPRRRIVRRQPGFDGHYCRMTREYTTTIEIDGRRREAYGTRCLTADGSWVLGRPKLVPAFD